MTTPPVCTCSTCALHDPVAASVEEAWEEVSDAQTVAVYWYGVAMHHPDPIALTHDESAYELAADEAQAAFVARDAADE